MFKNHCHYHTVHPVRMPGISAKKSGGSTKEFYIAGREICRGELELGLNTLPPPPEPETKSGGPGPEQPPNIVKSLKYCHGCQ